MIQMQENSYVDVDVDIKPAIIKKFPKKDVPKTGDSLYGFSDKGDELYIAVAVEKIQFPRKSGKPQENSYRIKNLCDITESFRQLEKKIRKKPIYFYSEEFKNRIELCAFTKQLKGNHYGNGNKVFYDKISDTEILSEIGKNQECSDKFVKKITKAAILWTLNKGCTLHFLLDKVNIKDCFSKSSEQQALKLTYSALRFIYRYWKYFEPFHKKGMIKFWMTEAQTDQLGQRETPLKENGFSKIGYKPKYKNKKLYANFFKWHQQPNILGQLEEQWKQTLGECSIL